MMRSPSCSSARYAGVLGLCFLVALVAAVTAAAYSPTTAGDGRWYELAADETRAAPELEFLLGLPLDTLKAQASIFGFDIESVEREGAHYDRLTIPGEPRLAVPGRPEIPVLRKIVAIPDCSGYELLVTTSGEMFVDGITVSPAPDHRVRRNGSLEYVEEVFALDTSFYRRDALYPETRAEVVDEGWVRDQRFIILELRPIQYNPARGTLSCVSSIDVELVLRDPVRSNVAGLGPMELVARATMENYDGTGVWIRPALRSTRSDTVWSWCSSVAACASLETDYLMIVEDGLLDSLGGCPAAEALATKRSWYDCFNVALVKTSDIAATISPYAIKTFIDSLYQTESAENVIDGRLGYVLLVGDAIEPAEGDTNQSTQLLPAYEYWWSPDDTLSMTTDNWYACLEGNDLVPDLALGRLAVSDAIELHTEAYKIIGYEPVSSVAAWRDSVYLSCGFANPDPHGYRDLSDAAHIEMAIIESLLIPPDYTVSTMHMHDLPSPQYDNARNANVAALRAGRVFVEQFGHGWPCGSVGFTADQADTLGNTDMLPFWINMSCSTGDFANTTNNDCGIDDDTDCLGEHLMHYDTTGQTGAIGFFGATEPASDMHLCTLVVEGLFHDYCPMLGQAAVYGKLKQLVENRGGLKEIPNFNLLGDPALDLFLDDSEGYAGAPDLVVRSTCVDIPSHASWYDDVNLKCEIRNEAGCQTPADTAVVAVFNVYFENGTLETSLRDTLGVIGAWSADTASVSWTPDLQDNCYYVTITADPDEEIAERSEANNSPPDSIPFCLWPLAPGFPVELSSSALSPLKVQDLDGDGVMEIVLHDCAGKVYVLDESGQEVWTFDTGRSCSANSPAIADMDLDGTPEIAVVIAPTYRASNADTVYVFNSEASPPGGNRVWKRIGVGEVYSPPLLVDVAPVDGRPEVVLVDTVGTGDARLAAWNFATDPPSLEWTQSLDSFFTMLSDPPTTVNYGLGPVDLIVWEYDTAQATLLCVNATHDSMRWKHEVDEVANCWPSMSSIAGDLDGDGAVEIVVSTPSMTATNKIMIVESATGDTFEYCGVRTANVVSALGNVDADSELEILATTVDSNLVVFDHDDCDPKWTKHFPSRPTPKGILIGDFDGGSDTEIVIARGKIGSEEYGTLYVLKTPASGDTLETLLRAPMISGAYVHGAICDLDSNGANDIVFSSSDGLLYRVEHLGTSTARFEWPMYQHGAQSSGLYEQPVSGSLTESASWCGDILVRGDVTVTDGDTLWIAAGTHITVASNSDAESAGEDSGLCELTVEGRLHAVGGGVHPVTFVSDDGGAADWYGVILDSASVCTLGYVEMTDAKMSLWATNPTSMNVHDCTFENHGMGETGVHLEWCGSSVRLVDCTIEDCSTGVRIDNSDVTISGNTVDVSGTMGDAYGLRITNDDGTSVRDNALSVESAAAASYGLHIDNADSALQICLNDVSIGDWHGVGMYFEDVDNTSSRIDSNVVTGTFRKNCVSKGLQFKNSKPTVRWNCIYNFGKASFHIYSRDGDSPDLGDTSGTDGNNATDTKASYYVYATARTNPINGVSAENNWWGTDSPSSAKFYTSNHSIDWQPYLDSDPNERRERSRDDEVAAAHCYFLSQNKPNPFNPVTTIQYGLAEDARALLRIYDVSGRLVRTLVDQALPAGRYAAVWDGTNERGGKVATGVYFCRFETEAYTESHKMVLLK